MNDGKSEGFKRMEELLPLHTPQSIMLFSELTNIHVLYVNACMLYVNSSRSSGNMLIP